MRDGKHFYSTQTVAVGERPHYTPEQSDTLLFYPRQTASQSASRHTDTGGKPPKISTLSPVYPTRPAYPYDYAAHHGRITPSAQHKTHSSDLSDDHVRSRLRQRGLEKVAETLQHVRNVVLFSKVSTMGLKVIPLLTDIKKAITG